MGDRLRQTLPKKSADPGPPGSGDERGRVIELWSRRPRVGTQDKSSAAPSRPAVEDIAKFERPGRDEDYRHRMLINVLGFLFCAALALAGIWLVNTIAELRQNQDCVLSGRRDCAHLDQPSRLRF
jgi:hypothetical protein